jgi:cytochrome c biogenesis protein CcmG, thiol:disulfide interchange protein DsbE
MRRAPLGALLLALALGACGGQTAGERVTTSPGGGSGADPSASAPAEVVAAADLEPCPTSDPAVPARADGLPDLVLACLGEGPPVRLAGLRGSPLVVNLWASWCPPCREELPAFARLAESGAVEVLGIDVEDDPTDALTLLADVGVRYPSVRDATSTTQAPLRWTGLPMTLLVDPNGVVVHTVRGPVPDEAALAALVGEHLGVTP